MWLLLNWGTWMRFCAGLSTWKLELRAFILGTGRPRSSVAGVGSVGLCGERRLGNHGLSNAFVCPGHSMLTSRWGEQFQFQNGLTLVRGARGQEVMELLTHLWQQEPIKQDKRPKLLRGLFGNHNLAQWSLSPHMKSCHLISQCHSTFALMAPMVLTFVTNDNWFTTTYVILCIWPWKTSAFVVPSGVTIRCVPWIGWFQNRPPAPSHTHALCWQCTGTLHLGKMLATGEWQQLAIGREFAEWMGWLSG